MNHVKLCGYILRKTRIRDPVTTAKDLENYLEKMQMMHIYQPVMIKTILESDNSASVEQIAKKFLERDQSQIKYYKDQTKIMPGKVLKQNGVVEYDKGIYNLNVPVLTTKEKSHLIRICDEKIQEYEKKYGKDIWKHRSKDSRLISGPDAFLVKERAKQRCELCGISAKEKRLDVDHIVPVNKGGKTVIENLQALCRTCNSQKRDTSSVDYRLWEGMYEHRDEHCPFCKSENSSKISNTLAVALKDKSPVTDLHYLVIPRRHVSSFFELGSSEYKACLDLLNQLKEKLQKKDSSITGFNVGINDSEDAGQTVPHCHIHLIPRRREDATNPVGGVRNIIPGKGNYLKSS